MRILHVSGTFLPVKGGGPYYVHYLSQHLERKGHTCRVVTTESGGKPETETVQTDRSPALSLAGAPVAPTFPLTLKRTLERFDPDIVHANYPLPFYPDVAAALARIQNRPLVVTCHGAFEMSFDSLVGIVGTVYNNSLLRLTLRAADRLHVSNRAILDAFDFYRRHDSKTDVVPIGVDTEWFDPTVVSGPPPYDVQGTTRTVLYVGSFRRYKGLDTLLRAFSRIGEQQEVQLVLVGDGPQREQLEQLVVRHRLTDHVQFVDHVDDERLRRAYAHADVFVLPSPTIRESLGMVAMEAMAMGAPTVVTAGSGIGHVLDGKDAGVVVEPNAPSALAEAIETLLTEETAATEQGYASRALVESQFAWTAVVEEYIELYEQMSRRQG